ncbi:hypothetical protein V8F33_011921 [Rhypophila sp. PSN 637]
MIPLLAILLCSTSYIRPVTQRRMSNLAIPVRSHLDFLPGFTVRLWRVGCKRSVMDWVRHLVIFGLCDNAFRTSCRRDEECVGIVK